MMSIFSIKSLYIQLIFKFPYQKGFTSHFNNIKIDKYALFFF